MSTENVFEKSLPAQSDLELNNETQGNLIHVDWDGPDDPANPMNWAFSIRVGHVVLVSAITLIVNLAATMFAPGASLLSSEFHLTNTTVSALTVSIYLLGFAVGPLIIAPLSELYGQLPVYHISNIVFLAFTIACAVSNDVGMFLTFRFFAGSAGSAPLALGGGTIGDVIPQEKRGAAMALWAIGPLLGPVIGPIAGGFCAEAKGWRWTFWVLAIVSGSLSLFGFIFMRETYSTVLLKRKARKLGLMATSDEGLAPIALFQHSIIRPLKLLFLSPIILLLSIFPALILGLIFLLFTTFPIVFEEQYGFRTGISGLSYLGLGTGIMLGVVLFGSLSDKILKTLAGTGEMKPEYRLPLMICFTPLIPAGFFWYGWTAYYHDHWIVPILGTALIGIGSLFVIIASQAYLVDAFGPYSASALAANTVLRSLGGTFLPLAGPAMYKTLGLGWGNTLLGFLALGMAVIPFFLYQFGERIRMRWPVQL